MYLSDVFTIPTNLAGDPAISVPFGRGEGGPARSACSCSDPAAARRNCSRRARVLEVGRAP